MQDVPSVRRLDFTESCSNNRALSYRLNINQITAPQHSLFCARLCRHCSSKIFMQRTMILDFFNIDLFSKPTAKAVWSQCGDLEPWDTSQPTGTYTLLLHAGKQSSQACLFDPHRPQSGLRSEFKRAYKCQQYYQSFLQQLKDLCGGSL